MPAGSSIRSVRVVRERGVKLGFKINTSSRGIKIVGLTPGTPGALCEGIEVGDMIIEIDGKPTFGMAPSDVNMALKGAGDIVSLRLFRSTLPGPTQSSQSTYSNEYDKHVTGNSHPGDDTICMAPFHPDDFGRGDGDSEPDSGNGDDDELDEFRRLELSLTVEDNVLDTKATVDSGTDATDFGADPAGPYDESGIDFDVTPPSITVDVQQSFGSGLSGFSNQRPAAQQAESFAKLQHLAKNDYSKYSQLISRKDGDTAIECPQSTGYDTGKTSGVRADSHHSKQTRYPLTVQGVQLTKIGILEWLQRNEGTAEAHRCSSCVAAENMLSYNNASASWDNNSECDDDDFRDDVSVCSDFSTTSRYSTTSRAALLEAKSAHAMKDVSRGITNDAATASFEVFKYQVLLTQLEAARARRTEALTRAIRTRDHVRLAMAEALGVERHGEGHEVYCLALDGLVGRTDQISEFSLSAGGNAAMVYSGPLGLDRERGTTRASISAMPTLPSGIPTLVPMGLHQTPTAAVMCNAVNVQLAQVNEAKKSADAACGELLAQQRKAELADRGLTTNTSRVVWYDGLLERLALSEGICHTTRGVRIGTTCTNITQRTQQEAPNADSSPYAVKGDVIVSVNGNFVLDKSKAAVWEMIAEAGKTFGFIDIEVIADVDLLTALQLRWFDDANRNQRCCIHMSSVNDWIKHAKTSPTKLTQCNKAYQARHEHQQFKLKQQLDHLHQQHGHEAERRLARRPSLPLSVCSDWSQDGSDCSSADVDGADEGSGGVSGSNASGDVARRSPLSDTVHTSSMSVNTPCRTSSKDRYPANKNGSIKGASLRRKAATTSPRKGGAMRREDGAHQIPSTPKKGKAGSTAGAHGGKKSSGVRPPSKTPVKTSHPRSKPFVSERKKAKSPQRPLFQFNSDGRQHQQRSRGDPCSSRDDNNDNDGDTAKISLDRSDSTDDVDARRHANLDRMLRNVARAKTMESVGVVLAESSAHEIEEFVMEVAGPKQDAINEMLDNIVGAAAPRAAVQSDGRKQQSHSTAVSEYRGRFDLDESLGVRDIDAACAEDALHFRYPWQLGPNSRLKMEQRRLELLDMDVASSSALTSEWMDLLRLRATVEHVQKFHDDMEYDRQQVLLADRPPLDTNTAANVRSWSEAPQHMSTNAARPTTKIGWLQSRISTFVNHVIAIAKPPKQRKRGSSTTDVSSPNKSKSQTYTEQTTSLYDLDSPDPPVGWQHGVAGSPVAPRSTVSVPPSITPTHAAAKEGNSYGCAYGETVTPPGVGAMSPERRDIEARARRRAIATRQMMLRRQMQMAGGPTRTTSQPTTNRDIPSNNIAVCETPQPHGQSHVRQVAAQRKHVTVPPSKGSAAAAERVRRARQQRQLERLQKQSDQNPEKDDEVRVEFHRRMQLMEKLKLTITE